MLSTRKSHYVRVQSPLEHPNAPGRQRLVMHVEVIRTQTGFSQDDALATKASGDRKIAQFLGLCIAALRRCFMYRQIAAGNICDTSPSLWRRVRETREQIVPRPPAG